MPKINNKYLVNSMASNTDYGAFIYFWGGIVSISPILSFVKSTKNYDDHFSHCTLLKTTKHFIPYIYRTHFNGAFLII